MASFQANGVGGLDPLTQSVYALSSAMFDPTIEYKRRLGDSQVAVDQAQIGNYRANSGKLDSETRLNGQKFNARAAIADIIKHAQRADGTIDPSQIGAISGALFQGSGDGSGLAQLGDVIAQTQLSMDPSNPAYGDVARNALIRMGKTPDQNFSATMGEGDHISARDANEAQRQAEAVQVLQNTQSGINNQLDNETSRFNNAADNTQSGINNELTVSNAFKMNEADNAQLNTNNIRDNDTKKYGDDLTSKTNLQMNDADNLTLRQNNTDDNIQSGANNDADNATELQKNKENAGKPLWSAYQDGLGNTFVIDTHAAGAPSATPLQGAPQGLNKIGTPKAEKPPKTYNLTPSQSIKLADTVAELGPKLGYGDVPDDVLTAVTDRAAELYAATGNAQAAVSTAYSELVQKGEQGMISSIFSNPPAVMKPQTSQSGAAAPQASKVINGVTYHLINGQWYSE